MDARTRVLWNGAKTETFAPQNDRAMERNVNFLLTATVHVHVIHVDKLRTTDVVIHTYTFA